MKKIALFLLASANFAYAGDTYVHGYTKKDGTYVEPHYRTAPDNNPYNNYSTKGNTNPYTGQEGTKDPYSNSSSGYQMPTPAPIKRTPQYGDPDYCDPFKQQC